MIILYVAHILLCSYSSFFIFLNSLEIALCAAIYLFILQNCLAIAHKDAGKLQLVIYALPACSSLNSQNLWLNTSAPGHQPHSLNHFSFIFYWVTGLTLNPTPAIPALHSGTWAMHCPFQAETHLEAFLSSRYICSVFDLYFKTPYPWCRPILGALMLLSWLYL